MERRFFLLAATALLLPAAAIAQPPGRDDRRPGRGPDRGPPGRPGPGMRPPPRPPQFSWHGQYHDRYRGPAFRYPRGYAYRRWSVGALLPGLFLGSAYFWDDWRALGVERPRPGRRWVRFGPDLLLVNIRTRRIEDVIYGAFY